MFAGKPFPFTDEIYAFKSPYSRNDLRVLLSVDYANSPEVRKTEGAAARTCREVRRRGPRRSRLCDLVGFVAGIVVASFTAPSGHRPEVVRDPSDQFVTTSPAFSTHSATSRPTTRR